VFEMLVLRPATVFVLVYVVLALIDVFLVNSSELVTHTYTEVLNSDMYVLVLTAVAVSALVEWLVRKKADAGKP
jgi:hypothetical protein